MRTLAAACALALAATGARAQGADTAARADTLGYDDAGAVAYLYNLPAALRATTAVTITRDQTVDGDVAVLAAPLTVEGHVTGHVVVINGAVTLRPGARIDGDLVVTGGPVTGLDSASVGGRLQLYAARMTYRREGDAVVAVHDETGSIAAWFRRWRRRHFRSQNTLVLRSGTYDRVEGLPVIGGLNVRRNSRLGPTRLEALGIYRSADRFAWKADNLGYSTTAEMQFGYRHAVAIGARAFDVVRPVESWQMRDAEIGLASFFLHRDFRDYYNSKGAGAYVSLRDTTRLALTVGLTEERWQPRATRDPFTLFRNGAAWRPNPVLDAGTFRIATATLALDTRNDPEDPWTGWLVTAELEHGWSDAVTLGPAPDLARAPALGPVRVAYTRGFLDARRYNRVSPEGQLNLRLVLGGWLGGDPLPLERRFSVGGPGTIPGYDFRQTTPGGDALTCGEPVELPGRPALCDRVALGQVEYRHDLHLHLFGDWGAESAGGGWSWSFYHPLQWVVFADAGRGWLLHRYAADGTIVPASGIAPLGTFKTDVGVGLDADIVGVFLAKSITDWGNSLNFQVRLRHRF